MVYALCVDRILVEHQAFLTAALSAGVAPPSLEETLAAFDESLAVEPRRFSPEELELRQALGVRSHR